MYGVEIECIDEFGEFVDVVLLVEFVLNVCFDGWLVMVEVWCDVVVVG